MKEELGLDHFEGRSWQGLHRHALMIMIAYAFLQNRRLAQAGREKKSQSRPASAKSASSAARRYRSPHAQTASITMSALSHKAPMEPTMNLPK